MKLSEIVRVKLGKVITIKNGEISVIETQINGDINFYVPSYDSINELKDILVNEDNTMKDISNEEFVYRAIPILTDLEVDVELDEFVDALESPNKYLATLFSQVGSQIAGLLSIIREESKFIEEAMEMKEAISTIDEPTNIIQENLVDEDVVLEEILVPLVDEDESLYENIDEPIEEEETIDVLFAKLDKELDPVKRLDIIKKISNTNMSE